jgi:dTDP-4-dehydrorhamnose 3,5-epimerase
MRTYDESIFRSHNLQTLWVQENQSRSLGRDVIRGLHFQRPDHTETKLIRVIDGAIFDVFVDLRRNSETYGRWDSIELSADTQNAVYIPKGFAHGFCTLAENTIVLYKVDSYYAPKFEDGIRWDDKTLGIPWPTDNPHLSSKDQQLGTLSDSGYLL